jgi:hypothetical protein
MQNSLLKVVFCNETNLKAHILNQLVHAMIADGFSLKSTENTGTQKSSISSDCKLHKHVSQLLIDGAI